MDNEKCYAVFLWLAEKQISVGKLSSVRERRAWDEYKVGDLLEAKCWGFRGWHKAELLAVGSKYISITLL